MKVTTKFKVDTTIRSVVIALLPLICYVTLWHWPLIFDLGQRLYMASHVLHPSSKFQDPTAICSWVISSDISLRLSVTMRLQQLHMRHITWPMDRFSPRNYLKSLTPICLFTIQLLHRYDDV